jgi:hypothetical protein
MRPDDLRLPESPPLDPALVERMAAAARRDLRPVRPLPGNGPLILRLFTVFCAVAIAGGALLGFFGLRRLSPGAIAVIFPELGVLALLTSIVFAGAMVPGSRRLFHPAVLLAAACILMDSAFVVLFPDHSLGSFVPQGLVCFRAGLIWAAPSGVLGWYALRRGFAVDRGAAGIAAGTFAGLTGLAMLELHCPNLRLPHVAIWHLAVVPAGALAGWGIYFLGSKRKAAELMQ